MKFTQLCVTVLPWLLLLLIDKGFCNARAHCQWGSFGDWSECDGCTKLQTRSRAMVVFAQFGGNPCDGARSETRSCQTTRPCPLEDGCGNWFRCGSGKCISRSLMCNGEVDCESDAQDEHVCDAQKYMTCGKKVPPPNIELLGLGFDVVSGQRRASVINTLSFGGQCRRTYGDMSKTIYYLPLSAIQFNYLVKTQNDFSDEMFTSEWHYAKDIVNRHTAKGTTTGYNNYDFHTTHDTTQTHKVLILKNDIEIVTFQSNSPQNLLISEAFWKAVTRLPFVYDYSAYREVLKRFGTHYLSEGSMGGSFKVVATVDEATERNTMTEIHRFHECDQTKRWFLIFPITHVECRSDGHERWSSDNSGHENRLKKVNVVGGGVSHIAALTNMQLSDPQRNWEMYSNWADSVRSFPQVTKQKLRPLSELVKEVQCAGVKKLYLRRAIEQYISESDSCHCQPCRNNGIAVMDGDQCKCICKPNTNGLGCEQGVEVEGQPGVIDGRWSCWSTWSSCSGGQRSRSRSCSNPSPQNGGLLCIGEPVESSSCEDEDLEYLKSIEPQCFDLNLPATPKCEPPPALVNGYILDPKDIYLVGSKVEYTCTGGLFLIGGPIECTSDLTWSANPGLCVVSRCEIDALPEGVVVSPQRKAFHIGEVITLSCTEGRELQGEATSSCDASRQFSPDPAAVWCSPVIPRTSVLIQCNLWEKQSRGKCVCKMPFECSTSSSLEFCATAPVDGKSIILNACKMHSLKCIGRNYVIAEDSTCQWPQRNTTGCTACHMWETCDDQTNDCRCKDSADCVSPGSDLCVRVGQDETVSNQTMSECEAGLRRCKGETVVVVGTLACPS